MSEFGGPVGVRSRRSSTDTAQARPGTTRKPLAIDLFCGAGGLSYGLEAAGFSVALGLDFNKHALETFRLNHSGKALLADAREVSGDDLLAEAGVAEIDLLAGGPSCQGFSTHGKRLADDPRNFLYREFMRLVGDLRPATVLMENVKGILISGKGAFREQVVDAFEEFGYKVHGRVLLAADYGVPQMRERVFFLASRLGSDITFPVAGFGAAESLEVQAGQKRAHRTVSDALGDLPLIGSDWKMQPLPYADVPLTEYQKLMRAGSSKLWNHVSRPLSPLAESIVTRLQPGQGLRSIPVDDLPERFYKMRRISTGELRRDCTTLYHRLSPDRPSYTITCNFTNVSAGAFTHPYEDRAITRREAARLQSFPDRFKFVGASIPHQIGNAVPPILSAAVGVQLREHLARHGIAAA
ncbi:MAG TPA: DNA cytosine methyltransferase [Jatrophihabitans sp.]|uniref:DNA cytosine methyltransferase n=1 Tax=Jatrophihabitans sp. TaxID=1932789 RepID=UPI002EF40040